MKKHLIRLSALILTAMMLFASSSCFRPKNTTDAPKMTETIPSATGQTGAGTAETPTETEPPETETQTATPVPTETETPVETPTPDLNAADYFGVEVDTGIKRMTLEGAEKIEDLLKYGNYLITIEASYKIERGEEDGPVYVRSYNLADGKRFINYKLPTSYYGKFMMIDGGGFAHWDELGNFIYFETPKDTEPLVFKDRGNSIEDMHEYDFYSDGSYLCDDEMSFIFGNVFDGTSETFTYDYPEGSDFAYVWKREGALVYLCFGVYEAVDGTPDVYIYDMSDKTLVKTDLLPFDDFEYGTDDFALASNHDGTLTVTYKDGVTPSREITLYRRSEYLVDVCDDYFITSYYHDSTPTVHTVYAIDGTPLFRGELCTDGYFGRSVLEKDGFFYNYSRYEDYECVDSGAYYLDLTKTGRPEPPEKDGEILNAVRTISEKYPVTVLYGEDAIVDFPDFTGEVLDDKDLIVETIELIETFLGSFPEGFFDEMFTDTGNGNPTHMTICLTGALAPTTEYGISNPAAYAYYTADMQYIVLDVTQGYTLRTNLAHETMHAIDRYLDALTDYSAYPDWEKYVPGMSAYNYSYKDDYGFDYYNVRYTPEGEEEIWFIDSYSKTFPTEDRARLFENMYTSTQYSTWLDYEHVVARMAYLCSVIRANFKCMENADTTIWESRVVSNAEDHTSETTDQED